MKKILIAGAGSYIGVSFRNYMNQYKNDYIVDTLDLKNKSWRKKNFSDALIIKGVVDTFDVSLEAATYRCLELGLVKDNMRPNKVQAILDFIDLVS